MVVAKLLIRPYFVGGVSQWKLKTRANLPMPRNFWRRKNIERKTHQPFLESSKKPKKLFWRCNISATWKFSCICLFHLWGGGAGLPYAILAARHQAWETHVRNTWDQTLIQKKWTSIWNLKSYKSKPLDSRDLSLDFLQSPSSLLPLKM